MVKKILGNIYYVSDVHIDTHTDTLSLAKMERIVLNKLLNNIDLPLYGTLIIAGDLGHYPKQNAIFLKACETFFDKIFYVFGNHEMYLLGEKMRKRYRDSFEKLEDIKEKVDSLCKKTLILEGQSVTINDIKIFGTPMWYDFSYGEKRGYSQEFVKKLFLSKYDRKTTSFRRWI